MKLIHAGDRKVLSLIQKIDLDRSSACRLSNWCILYQDHDQNGKRDVYLLKNTFTRQIIVLSFEEYEKINRMRDTPIPVSDLAGYGLEKLIENHCIVPVELDDCKEYLSTLTILRIMEKHTDGYIIYTLFPTTGCNARCVYCFEYDYIPKTMTEETALATAKFIEKTKGDKPIKLRWFGGEPLAAASRIDLICKNLERQGVDFSSSIVTNGTLLTPDLAERAVRLWRLKKAQISMDGDRASYEERKRYIHPDLHNYEVALNGIRLLNELNVDIEIRCNIDGNNLAGLNEFCRDLHNHIGISPNLQIYFSTLYQDRDRGTAPSLINQIQAVEDYAESLGLRISSRMLNNKQNNNMLKTNYCMADNVESCVVIDPDGALQNCEHLSDENVFGNVWDGITDREKYESLRKPTDVAVTCRDCPYLPECTPFAKKGCPIEQHASCRADKQAVTENLLHRMANDIRRQTP